MNQVSKSIKGRSIVIFILGLLLCLSTAPQVQSLDVVTVTVTGSLSTNWTSQSYWTEFAFSHFFDQFLRSIPENATITLSQGTFYTRGNYAGNGSSYIPSTIGFAVKSGWTISGQGEDFTEVTLVAVALNDYPPDASTIISRNSVFANNFGGSPYYGAKSLSNVLIEQITINCNYGELSVSGTDIGLTAIDLYTCVGQDAGGNITVSNVKVIGSSGRRYYPNCEESFSIRIIGRIDLWATECRVEQCTVGEYPTDPGYVNGIALTFVDGGDNLDIPQSWITGCVVTCPGNRDIYETNLHNSYYGYNVGGTYNVLVQSNSSHGASRGLNADSGPVMNLRIFNNCFMNSYWGICIMDLSCVGIAEWNLITLRAEAGVGIQIGQYHTNQPTPHHWTIRNNTISGENGQGIWATGFDDSNNWTPNLTIQYNVIDSDLSNTVNPANGILYPGNFTEIHTIPNSFPWWQ
jgi:hypothetical protein